MYFSIFKGKKTQKINIKKSLANDPKDFNKL